MNRPMTQTEREQARRDYLADPSVSVAELAAEYGVSRSAMLRALHGITRPKGGIIKSKLTTEQMAKLYFGEGLTQYEIAKRAGITESGVSRRLSRMREAV